MGAATARGAKCGLLRGEVEPVLLALLGAGEELVDAGGPRNGRGLEQLFRRRLARRRLGLDRERPAGLGLERCPHPAGGEKTGQANGCESASQSFIPRAFFAASIRLRTACGAVPP